jgi:hypothetical protein
VVDVQPLKLHPAYDLSALANLFSLPPPIATTAIIKAALIRTPDNTTANTAFGLARPSKAFVKTLSSGPDEPPEPCRVFKFSVIFVFGRKNYFGSC